MQLADWNGFPARRKESERRGKLRGRAVTPYIELGGVFNERMEIRFDPGGMVTIIAGTHSHGQGHATAFSQLVAEWLGVPFEAINYIQGDTEKVAFGRGTFAARSSLVGGNGLRVAADAVIARGKEMAGALMEAAPGDIEFNAGTFTVMGTDKRMSIGDVARAFFAPAGPVMKFGLGLDGVGTWSGVPGGAPNYPNGCQVCEVEVDPETGAVRIDRFVAVDDLGMIINPMICEGQIHGGIAQGVGQALFENVVYDRIRPAHHRQLFGLWHAAGRRLSAYRLGLVEIPAKTNPLGIKGIGEAGTIAAPPTVVNAVLDALQRIGVEHLDMPLTPARIWEAANSAQSACRNEKPRMPEEQHISARRPGEHAVKRRSSASTKFRRRTASPTSPSKGPMEICGSVKAALRKSAVSIRMPARSASSRSLPPTACRSASLPAATAISGSPRSKAIASVASPWTAPSPSLQLPTAEAGPDGIVLGPDGNIWFSEGEVDRIARVTPDGRITEFGAGMTPGSRPLSIVVRDGALWFSQADGGRVARMTLDGDVTEFPIPSSDSQPRAMTLHPDGSIWFVETGANALGRIARDGTIVEFAIPTPNASPRGVAVTADGDLWFTENFANKIGRMDANGSMIGEYDIPTPASGARCIAAMSDGRLFFTQYDCRLDRRDNFP